LYLLSFILTSCKRLWQAKLASVLGRGYSDSASRAIVEEKVAMLKEAEIEVKNIAESRMIDSQQLVSFWQL